MWNFLTSWVTISFSRGTLFRGVNFLHTSRTVKVVVFWYGSYVVGYQRFGCPCCLHLQGGCAGSCVVSYLITTRCHNPQDHGLNLHLKLPLNAHSFTELWKSTQWAFRLAFPGGHEWRKRKRQIRRKSINSEVKSGKKKRETNGRGK
jgi:hypothetical protein